MRSRCIPLALGLTLLAAHPVAAGISVGGSSGGGAVAGTPVKVVLAPEDDPDGSGEATLLLDPRHGGVCFAIELEDVDPVVADYGVRIVLATREPAAHGIADIAGQLEYGASPRASIGLVRAGRAVALLRGRDYVLPQPVPEVKRTLTPREA